MSDLFIGAGVGLYLAELVMSVHYSRQNSQPARRLVAESLVSPLVDAGFQELVDAVCGPRPEEVRDVEAR